jgi:general stress protein YciG
LGNSSRGDGLANRDSSSLQIATVKGQIMADTSSNPVGKSTRGFASMDRAKQREIARKGGESVPNEKRSFSQDRQLAAAAGRKGGEASQGARRRTDADTDAD